MAKKKIIDNPLAHTLGVSELQIGNPKSINNTRELPSNSINTIPASLNNFNSGAAITSEKFISNEYSQVLKNESIVQEQMHRA